MVGSFDSVMILCELTIEKSTFLAINIEPEEDDEDEIDDSKEIQAR